MKSLKFVVAGLAGVVWLCSACRVLGQPACPGAGTVYGQVRITEYAGGFGGDLDSGDRFGSDVTSPGDIDGDGVADLVVGANYDDDGGTDPGAVWVLFMTPEGAVRAHQKISSSAGGFTGELDNGDNFGIAVSGVGDLDGDGVPDLAVGAITDDDEGFDRGAVWILFLRSDGTVRAHQKISAASGGFAGVLRNEDHFGISITDLGDLDGDGTTDIAVGASLDDDSGTNRGAFWVLFLNADGTVRAHQKVSDTAGSFGGTLRNNDNFGSALASLGDLDGDGIVDLAVGAWLDDDGGPDRGAVWILFLRANGTVRAHQKISDTRGDFLGALDDDDLFGIAIGAAGDLDQDGVDDLLVGANRDDDGGAGRGAVWVLFLRANGTVRGHQKISQLEGGFGEALLNGGTFGRSVHAVGDLDGDGRPEIVVGAHAADATLNPGEVWFLRLNNCSPPPTRCPADFDGDGSLTIFDFLAFSNAFDLGCP